MPLMLLPPSSDYLEAHLAESLPYDEMDSELDVQM